MFSLKSLVTLALVLPFSLCEGAVCQDSMWKLLPSRGFWEDQFHQIRHFDSGISGDQKINPEEFLPQIRSAAFIGSKYVWLVTLAGDLWYTRNAGESWERIRPDKTGYFICVGFIDKDRGWSVGKNLQVWHTTDGGREWNALGKLGHSVDGGSVGEIQFVDELHGWVVGSSNEIWKTEDGGAGWQPSMFWKDHAPGISRSRFLNHRTGWLAGDAGTLYQTSDSGRTWHLVSMRQYYSPFTDVFFVKGGTGWAAGCGIYKTTNGGKNWRPQLFSKPEDSRGFCTQSIYFINKRVGWAAGGEDIRTKDKEGGILKEEYTGIILKTEDGGRNWTPVMKSNNSRLYRVHFADVQHGWVIDFDSIYRTKDGGEKWGKSWSLSQVKEK